MLDKLIDFAVHRRAITLTATLLLADLYMRGNGVSKNCDQARLLLVAAAKKGDSAAGDKLRQFESSGCQ